nr:hypothetical protein [Gemmatimonadaceae bacterium]
MAAWLVGIGFGFALEHTSAWKGGAAWERAVLFWIHARPLSPFLDSVMLATPYVGTNLTIIPVILVSGAWMWRQGHLRTALHLLVVSAGSLSLNPTMKHLLNRPRPALFPLRGLWDWPSYPSGHAILTPALYVTIALLMHRRYGWRWGFYVAPAIVALTSYSR